MPVFVRLSRHIKSRNATSLNSSSWPKPRFFSLASHWSSSVVLADCLSVLTCRSLDDLVARPVGNELDTEGRSSCDGVQNLLFLVFCAQLKAWSNAARDSGRFKVSNSSSSPNAGILSVFRYG
ncbi:hypothetical protein HYQ46_004248 [Verticillium longisporum]|nr:hypothetical protein HYQ46_004248 [Verticillium longisporum]